MCWILQGERGECGPPGAKGDIVSLLLTSFLIKNLPTVLLDDLHDTLQGPEGSSGPPGPKGEQVNHLTATVSSSLNNVHFC